MAARPRSCSHRTLLFAAVLCKRQIAAPKAVSSDVLSFLLSQLFFIAQHKQPLPVYSLLYTALYQDLSAPCATCCCYVYQENWCAANVLKEVWIWKDVCHCWLRGADLTTAFDKDKYTTLSTSIYKYHYFMTTPEWKHMCTPHGWLGF